MNKPNTYAVVKTLVYLQAAGAATISFMHIVEVGMRYGLGWQSWVAPFLIDGFAILGTIGRGPSFAEATRKTGFRLMLGAGVVSLVCNVLAGQNVGQRVFGVLVVAGFVTAEWYAAKLHRAVPVVAPELVAKRKAAAAKGAATRKRNAASKRRTPKAPATVAGLEKQWQQVAPQSPAMA